MTDHKAEALRLAEIADNTFGRIEHRNGADAVSEGVEALMIATEAQVHATLYLAEQQRIANVMALESMPTEQFDRLSVNTSVTAIREGLGL